MLAQPATTASSSALSVALNAGRLMVRSFAVLRYRLVGPLRVRKCASRRYALRVRWPGANRPPPRPARGGSSPRARYRQEYLRCRKAGCLAALTARRVCRWLTAYRRSTMPWRRSRTGRLTGCARGRRAKRVCAAALCRRQRRGGTASQPQYKRKIRFHSHLAAWDIAPGAKARKQKPDGRQRTLLDQDLAASARLSCGWVLAAVVALALPYQGNGAPSQALEKAHRPARARAAGETPWAAQRSNNKPHTGRNCRKPHRRQ